MRFKEDLADSEHDAADLAALAADLYDDDGFENDLRAALRDVLDDHVARSDAIDADALDVTAAIVFEEQLASDGLGGLFVLRGDLVTAAEADLQPGDVVRMESAKDPKKTIHYVVAGSIDPDDVRATRIKVDTEMGTLSYATLALQFGHVVHDDRYEISRATRDRDEGPWTIAESLLEDLTADSQEGDGA